MAPPPAPEAPDGVRLHFLNAHTDPRMTGTMTTAYFLRKLLTFTRNWVGPGNWPPKSLYMSANTGTMKMIIPVAMTRAIDSTTTG